VVAFRNAYTKRKKTGVNKHPRKTRLNIFFAFTEVNGRKSLTDKPDKKVFMKKLVSAIAIVTQDD
jgi:hypothetical protein